MLGTVGALQRGLDVNVKTRKWSHIAPLAASVADTCFEHWQASQEVMEQEERWAPASTPPWMPTPEAVAADAASPAATKTKAPKVAASSLLAAHVNRSLFRFYDKGEYQRGAEIEVCDLQIPSAADEAVVQSLVASRSQAQGGEPLNKDASKASKESTESLVEVPPLPSSSSSSSKGPEPAITEPSLSPWMAAALAEIRRKEREDFREGEDQAGDDELHTEKDVDTNSGLDAGRLQEVLRGAFGLTDAYDLETADLQALDEEGSLSSAQAKEERLINEALDQGKVKKDRLSQLSHVVTSMIDAGADPEDAVAEAILNDVQVMGNSDSVSVNEHDDPDPEQSEHAPAAEPTNDSIPVAFGVWQDAVNFSLECLQERRQACNGKAVGENKEISLVLGRVKQPRAEEEEESVFFVTWTDPAADKREGRPVRLDKENRVVCVVATGDLRVARDYRDVQIVHPACGARMERTRGWRNQLRPQVSKSVMRLNTMWKTALLARDELRMRRETPNQAACLADTQRQCFVCETSMEQPTDANGPVDDAKLICLCPCCTLPSHAACCQQVVRYSETHGIDLRASVDLSNAGIAVLDEPPFTWQDASHLACK
ncbi:unnamed protein product [Symbiodinium sp. CCMP2592]|nr:unnamed protein product [Symbiodinium sp. CCMP2592]